MTMRLYTGQHRFYCGIDLHTRTLSLCVVNDRGPIVCERTLPPQPDELLATLLDDPLEDFEMPVAGRGERVGEVLVGPGGEVAGADADAVQTLAEVDGGNERESTSCPTPTSGAVR